MPLIARLALLLACAPLAAWGALALWVDGPASRALAAALAAAVVLAVLVAPQWSARRGLAVAAFAWLGVLLWWLQLEPRNDRAWLADVARPAQAQVEGDRVTIANVRNFDYRSETDYTPRWETREYDLAQVRGFDLFMSYWGSPLIAHTILSWEFADGRHLAISIETRKEQGEIYSALLGFFRQFELYYVVADERDLVRLRSDFRGEQVFLYRLGATPAQARALLVAYLERINSLAREPAWYNAFTHNCTTSIRLHVQDIGIHNPWDWRMLVNGKGDEVLYQRGNINSELPFAQMRARSDITQASRDAVEGADYSARIRAGLPARPANQ